MKIAEILDNKLGTVFTRISKAFHSFVPNDVVWTSPEHADRVIIHVVGGDQAAAVRKYIHKAVIWQHCYYTTYGTDWTDFWPRAPLTVSFHPLPEYTDKEFNYHGTALGADPRIFKLDKTVTKDISVFTTGYVAESECIDILHTACKKLMLTMVHTGKNFHWPPLHYRHMSHMSDKELVKVLNRSKFVSALRLGEGFEVMGVEGLFCGARPIVPKLPTYKWYGEHALYIDTSQNIEKQLMDYLRGQPEPISEEEQEVIRKKFSWEYLVPAMFDAIRDSL